MGDVILTTSLVRLLRNKFANAQIDFLVSNQFSDLLKFNPRVSNIIQYDKSKNTLDILANRDNYLKTNQFKKYDIIIDLQNNLRSRIYRNGIAKSILQVKKRRLEKIALVKFKKKLGATVPIPELYLQTLKELDINDDGLGLELWLEHETHSNYYNPLANKKKPEKPRIGIAPGAHHATKRWIPEKFAELAKRLIDKHSAELILIGGKGDTKLCNYIENSIEEKIQNFAGKSSLLETIAIVDSCDLLITNDTGVMHIAAARQVPIVAIFGSTTPDFGFAPYRVKNQILEKELSCRPCTHIGLSKCPKGHFNCMKLITSDEVFFASNILLSNK